MRKFGSDILVYVTKSTSIYKVQLLGYLWAGGAASEPKTKTLFAAVTPNFLLNRY